MIQILENVDLQRYNTMAVPSVARFFCRATSVSELREALAWSQTQHTAQYVLGGGSNTLLDAEVNGLVIRPEISGWEVVGEDKDVVYVCAGAGVVWHTFVMECIENGYFGLENLALIPGHVGAAPIQNIGAYGVELKDVFHTLQAVNCESGELIELTKLQCEFGYRDSVFKGRYKNKQVITSVTFALSKTPRVSVQYPALIEELAKSNVLTPTPRLVAEAVIRVRRRKLPAPETIPNAGSFFKNPVVCEDFALRLKAEYPQMPQYDAANKRKKLAAGWLIEQCGWKGRKAFGVKVHDKQALVITNPNRVDVGNILELAASIAADVKLKFDVSLEREPKLLSE